jgi:hypothetical protein
VQALSEDLCGDDRDPFYGKHTPRKDILESLAMLAEGMRISSISRVKGFKEDTILAWLREAAEYAAAVEAVLMHQYQVTKAQIDGLWAYVLVVR